MVLARTETISVDNNQMTIFQPQSVQPDRLLLIEADAEWQKPTLDVLEAYYPGGATTVITSLARLHQLQPDTFDIAICGVMLDDGGILDVLAYMRGVCPDLPVIVIGESGEADVMVEAIRAGALDFIARTTDHLHILPLAVDKCRALHHILQENRQLHLKLNSSVSQLADRNAQLAAANQQLEAVARTDELTGLANRRNLLHALDSAWKSALRHGHDLALLMIDLDGFKSINDRFGHQRGDELLRLMGRVLEANCREVDMPARYGGDEFSVLMPHTGVEQSCTVAQRIMDEFIRAIEGSEFGDAGVRMSIGVAHISLSRPATAEALIRHADNALYAAKACGKGRIRLRGPMGTISPETA